MRILVTYASRHASTEGIAEALAGVLRDPTEDPARHVDVLPVEDVTTVDDYDAVVIGSAVYLGRWMDSARRMVDRHAGVLATRPVWLFSSGPLGEPAVPGDDAADGADLADRIGARGHRTFSGALRRAELSRSEQLAIRMVHAPEGDYRDWAEIRHWGEEIADTLASLATR